MSKLISLSLVAALAALAPAAAFAGDDAAYCKALVVKYERYLDQNVTRVRQPQSLDARVSLTQCIKGDPAGIPGLEKALRDSGQELPSRS